MMIPTLLQQSQGWVELVVISLMLIMGVGGWIINEIKKAAEQNKSRRSPSQDEEGAVKRPSLDELAARRRAELQELRRKRQEAEQQGLRPPPVSADPGNLTMAERIERARARAQYQQRAEQLRRGEDPDARQRTLAAQQRREEQERARRARQQQEHLDPQRQTQRRLEAERARQAEVTRRRAQEAADRARRQAEAQRRAQQERAQQIRERQRRADAPDSRVTAAVSRQAGQVTQTMQVTPSPARGAARTAQARPGGLGAILAQRRSLRQAIVLKEILDRPVALRQPQDEIAV